MTIADGFVVEQPLGADNADNDFASTNVVANADGSVLERLEFIQAQVAAFAAGESLLNGVVDTAAPSATNVKCAGLAGFGEDFFNNTFYMQVIRSGGAAPEPEVRLISNYVTATGTFTTDAFSENVEAGDLILILHESVVATGRNDADNTFDSSSVVANADGSILERLAYLQTLSNTEIADILAAVDTEIADIKTETDKIAAEVIKTAAIQADIGDPSARTNFKSLEAILGLPDAVNSNLDDMLRTGFDSSAITADNDGSIMERLEDLKDLIDVVDNYIDTEVAAITIKLIKPVGDVADDATIADVVGIKADTVGGTSLVAIGKQAIAAIAALNNISTAEVNTEVDNALDTIVPAAPTAGSLNDILSIASGSNTFDKATDSLEAIADAIAAGFALTGDAVVAHVLEGDFFYKDDFKTKLEGTAAATALASKIETLDVGTKKIVTIYLNQIVTAVGDAAALKAGITIATDGINYAALGGSDTVAITGGSTIVVTFDAALTTATNLIKVAAATVKDVFSISNAEVITATIDAS